MINIDDDPKQIVKELSETEKNILYILGKMRISVKKNFIKLPRHVEVVDFQLGK